MVKTPLGMRSRIIAAGTALVVFASALAIDTREAKAAAVPEDFRVYDNYANVSKLADYNDVQSDYIYYFFEKFLKKLIYCRKTNIFKNS